MKKVSYTLTFATLIVDIALVCYIFSGIYLNLINDSSEASLELNQYDAHFPSSKKSNFALNPRTFLHIGISAPDLDAAVKLYTEVFGWSSFRIAHLSTADN